MPAPSYRNPHNDPPKIGEVIHYNSGYYESPGIVSERAKMGRFPATIFRAAGPEVLWLEMDAYDPTSPAAPLTWHFHHLSQ